MTTGIGAGSARKVLDCARHALDDDSWIPAGLDGPEAEAATRGLLAATLRALGDDGRRLAVWTARSAQARIIVPADRWVIGNPTTVLSLDGERVAEFVTAAIAGVTQAEDDGPEATAVAALRQAAGILADGDAGTAARCGAALRVIEETLAAIEAEAG